MKIKPTLTAALALALALPWTGASAKDDEAARRATAIHDAKMLGAKTVAESLARPAFRQALHHGLQPVRSLLNGDMRSGGMRSGEAGVAFSELEVQLHERGDARAMRRFMDIDRAAVAAKGLDGLVGGVMQVRLFTPPGQTVKEADLSTLLVAFEPLGDEASWTTITAFDSHGREHLLDARTPPAHPLLIVDVDARESLRAGLQLINTELGRAGMSALRPRHQRASPPAAELTVLSKIHLAYDQEPWISGGAEVFAIVSGLSAEDAKPLIRTVDMPYLDYDNITYTPYQDMVSWGDFSLGAVNVQLFEQDDNTNYRDLASALLDAVAALLATKHPQYSFIPKMADAILKAMPAHLFTNDNDYVDSFYLIERGRSYYNLTGAAGNATVSFCPHRVGENDCAR